jgi:hypothetical protein
MEPRKCRGFVIGLLAGSSLTGTTPTAEYGPCLIEGCVIIDDVLLETEGGREKTQEDGGREDGGKGLVLGQDTS